jgi:hypothetical protein
MPEQSGKSPFDFRRIGGLIRFKPDLRKLGKTLGGSPSRLLIFLIARNWQKTRRKKMNEEIPDPDPRQSSLTVAFEILESDISRFNRIMNGIGIAALVIVGMNLVALAYVMIACGLKGIC